AVALLDQLGLPLPRGLTSAQLLATLDSLLAQTSAVRGQVTGLQDQISGARAQLASLTGQRATATALVSSLTSQLATQQSLLAACVVPALCAPIQALVDSLTAQLSSATSQVASLDALIAPLQAQIDGLLAQVAALLGTLGTDLRDLLDGILGGLADASLLSLDDLVVGVTARAGTTLASSVATVVGSVGAVRIGDQSLGGIDAGAASTQIAALSDQVTSAVGGVLAIIDPSLAGLVQIDVLDQARSVSESGGATHAMATITALRALITPPDVCGVLAGFGLQDTLGSVLGGLGQLPAPLAPISEVLGTIGSTVTCAAVSGATPLRALTQPTMVEALSISGAGSFSVLAAAAPGSPGELPATGGDGRLAMLAVVMLAAGLASRRLLGRAA
ncbi:MAG: hypothetical protein ABIY48_12175, partial [Acidimicrobiales bacterium]